jgi:hypothetical protein
MKKRILFSMVAALSIMVMSCEKEKEKETPESPKLILSSDTINFTGSESKSLFLSVQPSQKCDFQVLSQPDWVTVTPNSGTIDNNIVSITLTSNLENQTAGEFTGNLVIMSTLGNNTVFLRGVLPESIGYTVNDSLIFSEFSNQQTLQFVNTGNVNLSISASTSDLALTLSTTSDVVTFGESRNINVTINRQNMETGTYNFNIFLTVNQITDTIPVLVNHFQEKKYFLNVDVVDAEYSKITEKLVFVSANETKVFIIDPVTNILESIDLTYIPTCVSISTNGETALVGHDGNISYVSLTSKSVIRTYSITCSAFDIVLADNLWAYVFPVRDQWEHIRCVNLNLAYDNEMLHSGYYIYHRTKAKLHPSGKYIYGADNGLSPSDLEKYDIQNGRANYMYDSPYHGTYPFDGDLWFSEDGNRIFTKGGTVVRTSENQGQDMTYNGSISIESSSNWSYSKIIGLVHSNAKQNLYLITSGDDYDSQNKPFAYIYNSTNLLLRQKVELEKYLVATGNGGGNFYDAVPYHIFCNANGSKVFIVTRSNGSGLEYEWAIQTIEIQ